MDTRIIAGILGSGALVMGGVDASVLDETPIERVEQVASERVEAKQIENRVETTLPWKGQPGIKVVYDMGEPTLAERTKDKRDREVVTEPVDFGDGGFKVDIILNKKPDTNRFCYTIEGAENYDFFYQPPLTEQEIKEGAERPPEIEGSYAVYHKTLKNNDYKTGKVMHVPRPQVWSLSDESNKVWADMSYDNGQLCVTAPQKFLDTAPYPIRIDPTFGYTSVGGSSSSDIDPWLIGSRFSAPEGGSLTSVSSYLGYIATTGGCGTLNAVVGIYDSGGSKVTQGSAQTVSPVVNLDIDGAWYEFSMSATISATDYDLVNQTNKCSGMGSNVIGSKYDSGSSNQGLSQSNAYNATMPSSISPSRNTRKYSIFATYTASAVAIPSQDTFWFD